MKILISDDTPRKYERLVERLLQRGFTREDIKIVTSADAALAALASERYELLVIDILLPRREEEEPDSQHSIDLVTEIVESDGINREPPRVCRRLQLPNRMEP